MNYAVVSILVALLLVVGGATAYFFYKANQPTTPPPPPPPPNNSPSPPPSPSNMGVHGNDGSCRCDNFCARNWGNQLPHTWNGAKCVKTNLPGVSCRIAPGKNVKCLCKKTGTGWFSQPHNGCDNKLVK